MLFGIRTTCQRQEKVGICRNTYREPFLCYWNADDTAQPHPWSSSCDWSITEQRYSSDFATPSKTVIEIPSCFTHVFGNQWVTSLWKLRHLGKLVFGYVTVKLVIYQKTEILLVCLLSVKNTLFHQNESLVKTVVRNTCLWAQLRQGQHRKKLPGTTETWKGQNVYMGSSATLWYQHCHASKQHSQWVMLYHNIPLYFGKGLAPVPELLALWLLPVIPAELPWRTAAQLVQTQEVNWTAVGDRGWEVLLALENAVL